MAALGSLELAEGGREFFRLLLLRGSVEHPDGCLEEEELGVAVAAAAKLDEV